LYAVLLITQYEAVIALVGFAHIFSRTTKVLSEKVAPVTAPALPEQIDPAFANIETEDIEAPAQLWMSMEAPAFSVFVVDVGVPKLPITARDHFGKCIEQQDKQVTQCQLELELTEAAHDIHDRCRNFQDNQVVAWFSLTDEQDPFRNHVIRKDEWTHGENFLKVIGPVIQSPGRDEQRRKDLPKLAEELPKLAEDRFVIFHKRPPEPEYKKTPAKTEALF
jgi:hypothetical protein